MVSFTTSSERVTRGYYNAFYSMFVAFLTSFRVEVIHGVVSQTGDHWELTKYIENIQSNEIRGRMKRINGKIFLLFRHWTRVDRMSDEDREFALLKLRNDPLYPLRIAQKELPVRPRWSNEVSPCLILSSNLKMDNGLHRHFESTV